MHSMNDYKRDEQMRREILTREQQMRQKRFHCILREQVALSIQSIKNGQGRILEVGCGHADVAINYIAPNCKELIITDIERFYDPDRLPSNTRFQIENSLHLSFEDESFDGVYSVDVIEHIPDYRAFVLESLRVLRPGGKLLYTTPNRHRFSVLVRWLIGKPIRFPHTYGLDPVLGEITHDREFSQKDLHRLHDSVTATHKTIRGIFFGIVPWNLGISKPPWFLKRFADHWLGEIIK